MSKQRHQTPLPGHDGPYFPDTLDHLAHVLEPRNYTRADLEAAAQRVDGFLGKEDATTSDGYWWFAALRFATNAPRRPLRRRPAGRVVILIPWSQDYERQDGTSTDRSIAVYTTNDGQASVAQLVEDYANAIANLFGAPTINPIPDSANSLDRGATADELNSLTELKGSDLDSALQALNERAVNLIRAGRYEEALPIASDLYPIVNERYGQVDQRTYAVIKNFFELLLITGEPNAASQLIETACENYAHLNPQDPARMAIEERASAMRAMQEFWAALPQRARSLPAIRVPPDVTGEIAQHAASSVLLWYQMSHEQAIARLETTISLVVATPPYDAKASLALLAVFAAMKLQEPGTTQDQLRLLVEVLTQAITEALENDLSDAAASLTRCRELVLAQLLRASPARTEQTLDEQQHAAETAEAADFYAGEYPPLLQGAKDLSGGSQRDQDFFAMMAGFQKYEAGGDLDQLEAAAAAAQRLHRDQSFGELTERMTLPFRLRLFSQLLEHRPSKHTADVLLEAAEDALDHPFADPAEFDSVLDGVSNAINSLCITDLAYRPDLDRLVKLRRDVITKSPAQTASRSQRLHALAGTLRERYALRGDMTDLDDSIAFAEEIKANDPDSPRAGIHLNTLGNDYLLRHNRLGLPQDLDKAISTLTEALLHSPSHESSRADTLISLGSAYLQRANNLEKPLVSSAIDTAKKFLARTDMHDSDVGGQALREQIAQSSSVVADFEESLSEAAALFSAASDVAPSGSDARIMSLAKYGEVLLKRFDIGTDLNDAESALTMARAAVAESDGNGLLAAYSHQIAAQALRRLHHIDGSAKRAEEGAAEFRAACDAALPLSALAVLNVATEWAGWAFERSSWAEASEAMTQLVEAFELLYQAQSLRDNFASVNRRLPGLAGRLHYAMASCGRPEAAVELLERCRALHLTEITLRDQNVLEQLRRSGHETEVSDYLHCAARVRALDLATPADPSVTAGPDIDQVRQAREALDRAIAVIRGLPGMQKFHQRLSLADLQELAKAETLVYLSSSPAGGCASIVREGGVESIILPDLHDDAVREMARPWFSEDADAPAPAGRHAAAGHVRRLLPWLRTAAMTTLANALGDVRAATMVPTGLLVLLPLHAACLEQDDGHCAGDMNDRLIIRYSPTGEMASIARSAAQGRPDRSIMAILGSGSGLRTARSEVDEARRWFAESDEVDCSVEPDPAAAVLQRAGECDVLHVACHARSSVDVLDSRLWLTETSSMTLRDIRAISDSVRLAVLSACETSVSETVSPDEVVNFCTGLLATGTGGCVGSLWRVPDESTSLLMARFYREWKESGLSPAASLTSAQLWLQEATNRALNSWLPEVRRRPPGISPAALSLWEGARPFADPYFWAGFVYIGA